MGSWWRQAEDVALVLITPPAGHLVDVPSDVPQLAAARRAKPSFAAAVAADAEGSDTSSDETFTAWRYATASFREVVDPFLA